MKPVNSAQRGDVKGTLVMVLRQVCGDQTAGVLNLNPVAPDNAV